MSNNPYDGQDLNLDPSGITIVEPTICPHCGTIIPVLANSSTSNVFIQTIIACPYCHRSIYHREVVDTYRAYIPYYEHNDNGADAFAADSGVVKTIPIEYNQVQGSVPISIGRREVHTSQERFDEIQSRTLDMDVINVQPKRKVLDSDAKFPDPKRQLSE